MSQAIFIGLATIDIVYSVEKFPRTNTKVAAKSQEVYVGGPATNAAVTFAHLGGRAALVTAAGRHPLSHMIREELRKYSVQLIDLNPDFDEVPPVSSVSVDAKGQRNVVSANSSRVPAPQTGPQTAPQIAIDRNLLRQARSVLVDGHYMPACLAWAKAARENQTPVVFDGGSWKEGTGELLASVDTAICSEDFRPPGSSSRDQTIEFLKRAGVARIAITAGAEPIHFFSGETSGTLRVPMVEAIDTSGAGDILHGAFCHFASAGRGFVESLAEAAQIASESCRYRGAREWMSARPTTSAASPR